MTSMETLDRTARIAKGDIPGVYPIAVAGEREIIPNNSNLTIWTGPGEQDYVFTDESTDEITHISSSSELDTGVSVYIDGIDANWDICTQTVVLNGQNKVALTTPLIRVNLSRALSNLDGDVYIYEDTAISLGIPSDLNTVKCFIHHDINEFSAAIYSVPDNYVAISKQYLIAFAPSYKPGGVASGSVPHKGFVSIMHKIHNAAVYRIARIPMREGNAVVELKIDIPFFFDSKSDIFVKIDADGDTLSENASIYFYAGLELVRTN